MKNIIKTVSSVLVAVSFASCEGFLTKTPETSLSPSSFFRTKSDLELWTNKFYSDILPGPTSLAEIYADDFMGSGLNTLQKGTRTPSSNSWTTPSVNSSGYVTSNGTFTPLYNINYFLEHSSNCPDEKVREKYNGVAYFFRAWFYFEMVQKWGDMPWYDYVIASSDKESLHKPRDPRGFVMMKILEDCDKAYERLPEKWENGATYHVSKDAAMALKSRAALFEGTFRKYHAASEYVPQDEQTFGEVTISSEWFLNEAAKAASMVLGKRKMYTGNTMGLAPSAKNASYREYFVLETTESDETILSRGYNVDLLIRHGLQFDMKNKRASATQRFVNHYLLSNGKPVTSKPDWKKMEYYDQFSGRDPRMAQTLHGPTYVAVGGTAHEQLMWDRTISGYRIIKYISSADHENANTSTTDFPLIRYAEVLLNYAEAKAELGTLTDEDVRNTIDVIRDRVGMTKMNTVPTEIDPLMAEYYPNAKGSQLAAILEIRRERTVELCFEGFRQWDLLRWKEGKWITPQSTGGFEGLYFPGLGEYDIDRDGKMDICLYQGAKPQTTAPELNVIEVSGNWSFSENGNLTYYASENYVWEEGRDYLWPVPENQRQLTGGTLSQNPGWEDGVK